MQTVDKAMQLLNVFSIQQPEIGLSELARLSGFDKAATRRFLVALQKHDFIDQNSETSKYRLGSGFLHFAKIREITFPLDNVLQAALTRLMDATNETAHSTLLNDGSLVTIGVAFPPRANRVQLDIGEVLPLHATASGMVFTAFSSIIIQEKLEENLSAYTKHTETRPEHIKSQLRSCVDQGYAQVSNSYEDEVTGIATPFFNEKMEPLGTLALATPSSRMTPELKEKIITAVLLEAGKVTKALGGKPPKAFNNNDQENAA